MEPASKIVDRLGGNKAVADWLGLERTAVQRWQYRSPKGLDGRIPMKHWSELMKMGASVGRPIAIDELMPKEVAKIVRKQVAA